MRFAFAVSKHPECHVARSSLALSNVPNAILCEIFSCTLKKNKHVFYSCNHSKEILCFNMRHYDGSTLLVHTGSIDGMWKLAKQAVSNSWTTRVGGSLNSKLLEGVRVFEWRWQNGGKKDLMSINYWPRFEQSNEETREEKNRASKTVPL